VSGAVLGTGIRATKNVDVVQRKVESKGAAIRRRKTTTKSGEKYLWVQLRQQNKGRIEGRSNKAAVDDGDARERGCVSNAKQGCGQVRGGWRTLIGN
jgi:hypothetical protein